MPSVGVLSLAQGSFEALPGISSGAAWVRHVSWTGSAVWVCSPAAQAVARTMLTLQLRPRAPRPRLRLRGRPGRGRGGQLGAGPRAACLATPDPPTPPCSSGTSPTPPGEPIRESAGVWTGAEGCLGAGWAVDSLAVRCRPGVLMPGCRLSGYQSGVGVLAGYWSAGPVSGCRNKRCPGVGVLDRCWGAVMMT